MCGRGRPRPGWEWLGAFNPEDVADFVEEYVLAMEQAFSGQVGWDYPSAVLHEWQESVRALGNRSLLTELGVLRGATSDEEATGLSLDELRQRLENAMKGREERNAS